MITADNPDLRAPDFHGGLDCLVHSPGMEVQIYRRREDDPKRWEYLDIYLDDGNVRLEDLKSFEAGELDGIAPLERTRDAWGGGDYQFRFRWRDAQGRRTNVRSRDVSIAGQPVPRSGQAVVQDAPERLVGAEQNGDERIRAAAEREEVLTLLLIQSLAELRVETRKRPPQEPQASLIELATAMMTAVTSMTAPLLGALLADYAKPKPAPLDMEGMARLIHSFKERSTVETDLEAEVISSVPSYRRRRPLPIDPRNRRAPGSSRDR